MKTILKTVNPVTLSYAQSLLKDADIPCFIADTNVSIMDGSIGIFPQRLMVIDEDEAEARELLNSFDLQAELCVS